MRRRGVSDSEQAGAVGAAYQRNQQRGMRCEPCGEVGHPLRGVGHEHRSVAVERGGHDRGFLGLREPGVRSQQLQTRSRRRVQHAVAWIVLKQQRAPAARAFDRMVVQVREPVGLRGGAGEKRHQWPGGGFGARGRGRAGPVSVVW